MKRRKAFPLFRFSEVSDHTQFDFLPRHILCGQNLEKLPFQLFFFSLTFLEPCFYNVNRSKAFRLFWFWKVLDHAQPVFWKRSISLVNSSCISWKYSKKIDKIYCIQSAYYKVVIICWKTVTEAKSKQLLQVTKSDFFRRL